MNLSICLSHQHKCKFFLVYSYHFFFFFRSKSHLFFFISIQCTIPFLVHFIFSCEIRLVMMLLSTRSCLFKPILLKQYRSSCLCGSLLPFTQDTALSIQPPINTALLMILLGVVNMHCWCQLQISVTQSHLIILLFRIL